MNKLKNYTGLISGILFSLYFYLSPVILLRVGAFIFMNLAFYELLMVYGKQTSPLFLLFQITLSVLGAFLGYSLLSLAIMGVVGLLFLLFLIIQFYNNMDIAGTIFFGFFIVCFCFYSILQTRIMPFGGQYFWFCFYGFFADSFSYIGGFALGRKSKKLCPSISPKKTRIGAVCGLLASLACVLIYYSIFSLMNDKFSLQNFLLAAILGVIIGISAILGDLLMSYVKRKNNLKDFGISLIFPGHGGVLDRIDSMLVVAPVVYFYCMFFKIFE